MSDRLRFTRQMRLPEVGDAGQARLSSAAVAVTSAGAAAEIESRYLTGAGVTISPSRPRSRAVAVPDLGLIDPAAKEVAEGSMQALVTLKSILEAS